MKLHEPVLLQKALEAIVPREGESYLDLTGGYGGHASGFLERTRNYKDAVLVDRDDFAVRNLHDRFDGKGVTTIHDSFSQAASTLVECGYKFDIVFMDLGVSSPQLDNPERGFSFSESGPLDMRMDRRAEASAYDIVNKSSEDELFDIFVQYGEERPSQAKKIAQEIVNHRLIETTDKLAEMVQSLSRWKHSRTHPATQVFQALRIAVNDELGEITKTLCLLSKLTKFGGRVGIISFHSLEDRLVKQYFNSDADLGFESAFQTLTKKPIRGDIYDVNNPRARSAKLRVAVRK